MERFYRIKRCFCMVGRTRPPRPLHHQNLLGREDLVTEQKGMHLGWAAGRMYLKPSPRFLLKPQFWTRFLSCAPNCACAVGKGIFPLPPVPQTKKPEEPKQCKQRKLRRIALGLLFSYIALTHHKSNLGITKENSLLPAETDWAYWTTLVRGLDPEHIYPDIDERFIDEELSLSPLNKIFKLS